MNKQKATELIALVQKNPADLKTLRVLLDEQNAQGGYNVFDLDGPLVYRVDDYFKLRTADKVELNPKDKIRELQYYIVHTEEPLKSKVLELIPFTVVDFFGLRPLKTFGFYLGVDWFIWISPSETIVLQFDTVELK